MDPLLKRNLDKIQKILSRHQKILSDQEERLVQHQAQIDALVEDVVLLEDLVNADVYILQSRWDPDTSVEDIEPRLEELRNEYLAVQAVIRFFSTLART